MRGKSSLGGGMTVVNNWGNSWWVLGWGFHEFPENMVHPTILPTNYSSLHLFPKHRITLNVIFYDLMLFLKIKVIFIDE